MRWNKPLFLLSCVLILAMSFSLAVAKEDVTRGNVPLSKSLGRDAKLLDINQIEAYISNDGAIGENPTTGGDGFYFPRGQRTLSIIYTAGMWIIGKVGEETRSAVNCYGAEFQPGIIKPDGTPDDATLDKYIVYKYNKGDVISQDAIDQGCPTEVLGDQMLFAVYNDLQSHDGMWGSLPLGLEVQQTAFAFNRTGALGQTVFVRFRITNKGANNIDSTYIGMFYDPDLGQANDDLTGCDTTLGIAYVYNGDGYDEKYGVTVPALASDFFQGPIVPAPGETAVLPDGTTYTDMKILPMTAYFVYINGSPLAGMTDPHDPIAGNFFVSGFRGNGEPWEDPVAGITKFPFAGDPVTGTGWLLSAISPPKDVRMGNASGPFKLNPGDQQDIVLGIVVGQGTDNLSSITVMKFYDKSAQLAYDLDFQLPSPPPQPQVTVGEMDELVLLTWDAAAMSFEASGYEFEGYNVYQGQGEAGPWTKIGTFDKTNGITTIWDQQYNQYVGALIEQPVQFGKDNGIVLNYAVTKDYLTNVPLVNGKPYYFAVTGYAYNPEGVPKVLENAPNAIRCIPQKPVLDLEYGVTEGTELDVTHTGPSDGHVNVVVVNPTVITGDAYKVAFFSNTDENSAHYGETGWNLTNTTTGQTVLANQYNQDVVDPNPVFDGLTILVVTAPDGYKGYSIPSGVRRFTWAGGADAWALEGFSGALTQEQPTTWWGSGYMYPLEYRKPTLLKLATVSQAGEFDTNDENVSYGYRYLRAASAPAAKPEFAPYIVNPGTGYAFQEYAKSVPLSAWDVSNPASPRRLQVGYLENNQPNALVDGKYWPPFYGVGDNIAGDGPREWLFIFDDDYSETPNPAYTGPEGISGVSESKMMWWATWARRADVGWSETATGTDQFLIQTSKGNSPADQFTFSTTGLEPVQSEAIAENRLDEMNVFPNPYFGHNSAEGTFYTQFVTFTNLPETDCTIRIFSMSGQLVHTLEHTNGTPFERWYLQNDEEIPVASGMYIIHVQTKFGEKILKLGIINREAYYQHL